MRLRKLLPPMIMLLLQMSASADGGQTAVMASQVMAVSYWCYVAFLPLVIAAFVIHGWLIRPKE